MSEYAMAIEPEHESGCNCDECAVAAELDAAIAEMTPAEYRAWLARMNTVPVFLRGDDDDDLPWEA